MNPLRRPRFASALLATTLSLLAATALAPAGVDYVKWDQPPDPADPVNIYYGWNEESNWWYMGPTAADDWVCSTNDPVTAIRWWGSFKGWNSAEPPPDLPSHFHILFWTDVPVDPEDPNSFSHPGVAIHEVLCYNFSTTFVGWDYDPRTGSMEACFLFEQQLTPDEYFYQEPDIDQIYWLSISACWDAIEPPISWGWKTRPRDLQSPAPDDAVSMTDPIMPMLSSIYRAGKPLEFPEGTSWDLAFELISAPDGPTLKWEQPPDVSLPGLHAHDYTDGQIILADQWQCEGGQVIDLHWYGNYELDANDREIVGSGIARFHLSIHANENDIPWCLPLDPALWEMDVPITQITVETTGLLNNEGSPIYRYSYILDAPFDQTTGDIYWLDISAIANDPADPPYWRWQEAGRSPVPILCPAAQLVLPFPGVWEWILWSNELYSDLAFEISSEMGVEPYTKWSQLPAVYTDGTFFNGWNELSVHGGEQIAGDDWVCSTMDPVTDVHWWGSFIGWSAENPPQLPTAFHFAIWTDVPDSDPDDPATYSHPGTVVWEHYCYDYEWKFAGWDIDPRDAAAPPEACFYFSQDLPEDVWFRQPEPENIYWITIAAIYPDPNDCACEGDVNRDGAYSLVDLSLVASCVGMPPTGSCAPADVDCNGVIDQNDVDAVMCQIYAGWADPNCCTSGPQYPFGMKTRPRDRSSLAPDDAVRVFYPTEPIVGDAWEFGEPLFWPTMYESWDLCFQLTSKRVGLGPKWTQPPYPDGEGFDAPSNLWWPQQDNVKWELLPDPNLPGIHTDNAIHNADDWLCTGGVVTDFHWFGNYEIDFTGGEMRGSGISQFRLYIHADAGGVPDSTVLWSAIVPFNVAGETYTGLVNLEGSPIYRYDYYLDEPFDQEQNNTYWLHIAVDSNDIADPAVWRWQESGRTNPPVLSAAVQNYGVGWTPICWADQDCTDFAFIVTSEGGYGETPVNVVVADDFYSDGRDILALQWWGSYFDDRYEPGEFTSEPYALDGWFVTFHWADVNQIPQFPPDIRFDAHPTTLAVYFAPRDAVVITDTGMIDCNGHKVYEYFVRLKQCCLVCTHFDPRNNYYCPPGLDGCFQEITDYRYWLSIQAVTGAEWLPDACDLALTGHLPPLDVGLDGTFWGWHNGYEPADTPGPLDPAAVGLIIDFNPYPPDCWDYGEWMEQPWLCDAWPPSRVDMAFELLASDCPEDLDGNRVVSLSDLQLLLSAYGSCCGSPNYLPAADFNNDGCITLADLQILLSAYGSICPTR